MTIRLQGGALVHEPTDRLVYPDDLTYDDGSAPCPACGHEPALYICDGCDATGRLIDCGHRRQPPPIAIYGSGACCEECIEDQQSS